MIISRQISRYVSTAYFYHALLLQWYLDTVENIICGLLLLYLYIEGCILLHHGVDIIGGKRTSYYCSYYIIIKTSTPDVKTSFCFSASFTAYYTMHYRLHSTHKTYTHFYHPPPLIIDTQKSKPHLEKKLYKPFSRDKHLLLTYKY